MAAAISAAKPSACANEGYCLFKTPLGPCGIAWSAHGLTRLQLPHADPSATEAKISRHGKGRADPPALVNDAIAKLRGYFAGEQIELGDVALDIGDVGPFRRAIYGALRAVGWGETVSYGELARRIGAAGEARAVGQAMGRNPIPVIIPCHRVVTSDSRLGGFSAYGGALNKEKLLAIEGVYVGSHTPRLPGL